VPHDATRGVGAGQVPLTTKADLAVAAHHEDLYRLSDPRLSELGLQELLDTLLTRIRQILRVDTVAVLLKVPAEDELLARAAKGLEAEVEQRVRIPIGRGFAGRIAAERQAIFVPEVRDADIINPLLQEIGIRSLLGVPLIVEGQLLGVLHVGSLTPRIFTHADAALLSLAASRVAPGIERARLFDELSRQRVIAEALQRGLLPESVPDLHGLELAVRYIPAKDDVGGDWYEVMLLPNGRVGVAIGDVVGHGVRAAALMVQMRAVLRSAALGSASPATVLAQLDRYVQDAHPAGLATVLYAVLDPDQGTMTISNAGHPPPVVAGPDGAHLLESESSPPIGAVRYPHFTEEALPLPRGECVVFYTDGLIERRGESLEAGLNRLQAAAAGETDPHVLCGRVLEQLLGAFASEDDVAVVAFRQPLLSTRLEVHAPATRESVPGTRRRLRSWLHDQGVVEEDLTAILLAAGEGVANAVEHASEASSAAAGRYELHAACDDGVVIITVVDDGVWRRPAVESDRGRGLPIMRSVMDQMVLSREGEGTRLMLTRVLRGRAA
jgi:anti-sigma regulatory factor (Ser/Thr protein kinase)/putative methionine-R-sulfoxide reductase with GAF domain